MDNIQALTEVFKALSDPTRLRLVMLLKAHEGALCVNALASKLGVTQSAVSQHLRVLRGAGLVLSERQGPMVHYSLNRERFVQHRSTLNEVMGEDFW